MLFMEALDNFYQQKMARIYEIGMESYPQIFVCHYVQDKFIE